MSINCDWIVKTPLYSIGGFFIYENDVVIARVYENCNTEEIVQFIKLAPKMFQALKDAEKIVTQHDLHLTLTDNDWKEMNEQYITWWNNIASKIIKEVEDN